MGDARLLPRPPRRRVHHAPAARWPRAAAEGHRVVLVVATNGEYGEVPDDLADGETLVDRRRAETQRSADGARRAPRRLARLPGLGHDRLGAERRPGVVPAGRRWTRPPSGWRRSCARRRADVLTTYDWHGNYGHPDHVKVHQRRPPRRRARRHARRVRGDDEPRRLVVRQMAEERGAATACDEEFDPSGPTDDGNPFGMPEAELTTAGRRRAVHRRRSGRRSAATRSQMTDTGVLPRRCRDEVFAARLRHRVVHPQGRAAGHPRALAGRARLTVTPGCILVRHGRAAAGLGRRPRSRPRRRRPGPGRGRGRRRWRRLGDPLPDPHQPAAPLPRDRRAAGRPLGRRAAGRAGGGGDPVARRACRWPTGWRGCGHAMAARGPSSARRYVEFRDARAWPRWPRIARRHGGVQPLRRDQRRHRRRARRRPPRHPPASTTASAPSSTSTAATSGWSKVAHEADTLIR